MPPAFLGDRAGLHPIIHNVTEFASPCHRPHDVVVAEDFCLFTYARIASHPWGLNERVTGPLRARPSAQAQAPSSSTNCPRCSSRSSRSRSASVLHPRLPKEPCDWVRRPMPRGHRHGLANRFVLTVGWTEWDLNPRLPPCEGGDLPLIYRPSASCTSAGGI